MPNEITGDQIALGLLIATMLMIILCIPGSVVPSYIEKKRAKKKWQEIKEGIDEFNSKRWSVDEETFHTSRTQYILSLHRAYINEHPFIAENISKELRKAETELRTFLMLMESKGAGHVGNS